jgi:hypothetical protein
MQAVLSDIHVEEWLELRQPRWSRWTRFGAERKPRTMTGRYEEPGGMVE